MLFSIVTVISALVMLQSTAPSRLIWHRRDLRLADNELYHNIQKIYSVYIFDPSDYSIRHTGISDGNGSQLQSMNHGPHFSRWLIDAIHSLRCSLQSLGGDLIVRIGNPLLIVPQLADELQVDEVAFSEIPGHYEFHQADKLKKILQFGGPHRCKVFTTCSLTLIHPNDLPTDPEVWKRLARPNERQKKRSKGKSKLKQENCSTNNEYATNSVRIDPGRFEGMPRVMGDFRRVARTATSVRQLYDYPDPQRIASTRNFDTGKVPSLEELMKSLLDSDVPILGCIPKEVILKLVHSAKEIPHNNHNMEEQSMFHLKNFVHKHAATADRSLCDVSNNNSSMLSLPLALGILSARQVYHCVKEEQRKLETEQGNTSPDDINWLVSHMEMRDYFLFNCFRDGASAYKLHPNTPVHKPNSPREWLPLFANQDKFMRWINGKTGLPMVDAGMKELIATGYTSNRVRQNMASVLTKDLKLDWRLGAEWYQLCLEDHCVAANFGNWAYFAGVGGDPKSRHFRTVSQSYKYDPDAIYVRKWLKINASGVEAALRPWAFDPDWPEPVVAPDETQLTFHDKERLEKTGRISTACEFTSSAEKSA